jgi:hypothetical protein
MRKRYRSILGLAAPGRRIVGEVVLPRMLRASAGAWGSKPADGRGEEPALRALPVLETESSVPARSMVFDGLRDTHNTNVCGCALYPPDANGDVRPNNNSRCIQVAVQ